MHSQEQPTLKKCIVERDSPCPSRAFLLVLLGSLFGLPSLYADVLPSPSSLSQNQPLDSTGKEAVIQARSTKMQLAWSEKGPGSPKREVSAVIKLYNLLGASSSTEKSSSEDQAHLSDGGGSYGHLLLDSIMLSSGKNKAWHHPRDEVGAAKTRLRFPSRKRVHRVKKSVEQNFPKNLKFCTLAQKVSRGKEQGFEQEILLHDLQGHQLSLGTLRDLEAQNEEITERALCMARCSIDRSSSRYAAIEEEDAIIDHARIVKNNELVLIANPKNSQLQLFEIDWDQEGSLRQQHIKKHLSYSELRPLKGGYPFQKIAFVKKPGKRIELWVSYQDSATIARFDLQFEGDDGFELLPLRHVILGNSNRASIDFVVDEAERYLWSYNKEGTLELYDIESLLAVSLAQDGMQSKPHDLEGKEPLRIAPLAQTELYNMELFEEESSPLSLSLLPYFEPQKREGRAPPLGRQVLLALGSEVKLVSLVRSPSGFRLQELEHASAHLLESRKLLCTYEHNGQIWLASSSRDQKGVYIYRFYDLFPLVDRW